MVELCSTNEIRAQFSSAMSAMYRAEVPAYGLLVDIVETINMSVLSDNKADELALSPDEDLSRISDERHGAIRLGTAAELNMMRRVFAVMGMYPVGYYDLSVASVPVHSTAFRPIDRDDLAHNPFRVFTSLLRLELIEDAALREKAEAILAKRQIFTPNAIALTQKAELSGGLTQQEANRFVNEVLETFRWHADACVALETFNALIKSHRLTADVVSFKGPHINHLTPRTLDIDAAQAAMVEHGLPSKAVVEGPPARRCPILLRQTAFKALDEPVRFPRDDGSWETGHHTARFGEIEQRGVALTPKGRALYDELLDRVRAEITPDLMGANADDYVQALHRHFSAFPDNWVELYKQELAYFKFEVPRNAARGPRTTNDVPSLLDNGDLKLRPIIYEDFLPVSAAGIFQSNLGDEASTDDQMASSQSAFEAALGCEVADEFGLYERMQEQSLELALAELRSPA